MPQAKTTKKKPAARVGGGGVNTKKSKLNLKVVIPIIVLVAALGGFYIFRKSSAASWTTHKYRSFSPVAIVKPNTPSIYAFSSPSLTISAPYTYRWCVKARAPQGSSRFSVNGYVYMDFSKSISQSTSFTTYCGPAKTLNKGDQYPSLAPHMYIGVSGAKNVEFQSAWVERM